MDRTSNERPVGRDSSALRLAGGWQIAAAVGVAMALAVAACSGGGAQPTGGGATSGPGGTAGTGAQPTGGPVTDLTKLCDLLAAGDFTAVGITGASTPKVNSDGPGSAYCVYSGTSAATGGIEFDIFVDADPEGTFDTIVGETSSDLTTVPIPGVDEAVGTDGEAGKADAYATVVVRKGPLVFTIAAPGGTGNSLKLAALAGLVVARGAGLVAPS